MASTFLKNKELNKNITRKNAGATAQASRRLAMNYATGSAISLI